MYMLGRIHTHTDTHTHTHTHSPVLYRYRSYRITVVTDITFFGHYFLHTNTFVEKSEFIDLKLKFSQYSSIHTNYIIPHCTTLQYNHNS